MRETKVERMPFRVKFLLSLAWVVHLGQTGPSYAVAFLGVFAVFAMWVFPEVTNRNPASLK